MPELPEVTTVIEALNKRVLGHKIIKVVIYEPKIIKKTALDDFTTKLQGRVIQKISRLGKYLVFHLDQALVMVSHLRMEGKFFYQTLTEVLPEGCKEIHVLLKFIFSNNHGLFYHDTRRFGTFSLYLEDNYQQMPEIAKLAIDPLAANFDGQFLFEKGRKSKKSVKTFLLDQTNVSGIGNIYADEILFAALISPFSLACNLHLSDWAQIAICARQILQLAIAHKGTTIFSFSFGNHQPGNFQKFLKVHLRHKQPCQICQNLVNKVKINGRGTYFCSNCQKIR